MVRPHGESGIARQLSPHLKGRAGMSNGNWTPGPWIWVDRGNYHDLVGAGGICVHSDGSAGVRYSPDIDVEDSDARLIAAAPEMYEALQEALRWIGKLNDWEGAGDPDIDKWREALNKAKGGD